MMIIEGLAKLNNTKAKEIAYETAREWLSTVYCAWISTEHIFEKYNVTRRGFNGGGGEYEIQTGFGWTNGAVLMILKMYGDTITPMKCNVIYTPLDYLIFVSGIGLSLFLMFIFTGIIGIYFIFIKLKKKQENLNYNEFENNEDDEEEERRYG